MGICYVLGAETLGTHGGWRLGSVPPRMGAQSLCGP